MSVLIVPYLPNTVFLGLSLPSFQWCVTVGRLAARLNVPVRPSVSLLHWSLCVKVLPVFKWNVCFSYWAGEEPYVIIIQVLSQLCVLQIFPAYDGRSFPFLSGVFRKAKGWNFDKVNYPDFSVSYSVLHQERLPNWRSRNHPPVISAESVTDSYLDLCSVSSQFRPEVCFDVFCIWLSSVSLPSVLKTTLSHWMSWHLFERSFEHVSVGLFLLGFSVFRRLIETASRQYHIVFNILVGWQLQIQIV